MDTAIALVLYPGVATALIGAIVFRRLVEGRRGVRLRGVAAAARSADGLLALVSLALCTAALVLLPWPFHPATSLPLPGSPALLPAAIEGAFLLPALPALLAPAPLTARAASRESQMSLAGRAVVWTAIGAGLWFPAGAIGPELPGRLLILLAGLLALPAAIGVGPFGTERSLSMPEDGLDEPTTGLLRFARSARGATLLAALILAALHPLPLRPSLALALIVACFMVVALLLPRLLAGLPRFTLQAALRWCWWRALPPALIGLAYMAFI